QSTKTRGSVFLEVPRSLIAFAGEESLISGLSSIGADLFGTEEIPVTFALRAGVRQKLASSSTGGFLIASLTFSDAQGKGRGISSSLGARPPMLTGGVAPASTRPIGIFTAGGICGDKVIVVALGGAFGLLLSALGGMGSSVACQISP